MKKKLTKFDEIKDTLHQKRWFGRPVDDLVIKFMLLAVLVLVVVWLLPSERPFEYSNLTVGSISRDEIIAPFTFPILKSEKELELERARASLNVPPVFQKVANTQNVQEIKFKNLIAEITAFFEKLPDTAVVKDKTKEIKPSAVPLDSLIQQLSVKYNIKFTVDDIGQLFQLYQAKSLQVFSKKYLSALSQVYAKGILNVSKEDIKEEDIAVQDNGVEDTEKSSSVLDPQQAEEYLFTLLSPQYSADSPQMRIAQSLTPGFLIPNLVLNKELTDSRKLKAIHDVPPTSGFVYKNQRIVDSHEIITENIYLKLKSLAEALKERSTMQMGWNHFLFLVGEYLFAVMVILILGGYIYFYRRKMFYDNKMLLLITVVLLMQFLFSILITGALKINYLGIPITVGAMMLSMLIDAPLAFWGTVTIALVLGASQGNSFYLTFLTLIVGTVALLSLQKIRNRGQMFRAILYITLGYLLVNISYGFIHFESLKTMMQNFVFYQLPNAILAPTAVFLFIGVFERLFDVTTDITLLELSDLNHPLLKRLSVEAPGTFHHSILVGNLAEAAAKAIGANSLLARVGCYYHDIGKMIKPEYFVENQADAQNKHEKLTPTMSSLVLAKHVKAGLELADKYNLPKAVKQFIPEHHGTSIMSFFYHKALETMDPKDVRESDFRYPGPKPQSKETGIAMLSDTVEAAVRTLTNPTPQRIRTLLESLMEKKFQEGELDECDISLRELNQIKEAFIPILQGIHHLRVEYPEDSRSDKGRKGTTEKKNKNGDNTRSQKDSEKADSDTAAAGSSKKEATANEGSVPAGDKQGKKND